MLEHMGKERERERQRESLTHPQGQNGRNFRISCVWHFVSSSPLPINPVPVEAQILLTDSDPDASI